MTINRRLTFSSDGGNFMDAKGRGNIASPGEAAQLQPGLQQGWRQVRIVDHGCGDKDTLGRQQWAGHVRWRG